MSLYSLPYLGKAGTGSDRQRGWASLCPANKWPRQSVIPASSVFVKRTGVSTDD